MVLSRKLTFNNLIQFRVCEVEFVVVFSFWFGGISPIITFMQNMSHIFPFISFPPSSTYVYYKLTMPCSAVGMISLMNSVPCGDHKGQGSIPGQA